jgi:hypothetical protein
MINAGPHACISSALSIYILNHKEHLYKHHDINSLLMYIIQNYSYFREAYTPALIIYHDIQYVLFGLLRNDPSGRGSCNTWSRLAKGVLL